MTNLYTRALDCLADFVAACPQSGPDAADRDIDHEALVQALANAEVILYETGRRGA